MDIKNNTFDGVYTNGVYIQQTVTAYFEKNTFQANSGGIAPITGLFSQNSLPSIGTANNSDENIFKNLVNGVTFLDTRSGSGNSNLQHNKFQNNTYGLVVAPKVYPMSSSATGYIANGIEITTAKNVPYHLKLIKE